MSVTKVTKKLIEEIEVSEIDFDLQNEFKKDPSDDDEEIDFVEKGKQATMVDATPINIERLEKLLAGFKEKGATHVEIEYHGDHFGYMFGAFKYSK